MYDRRDGKIEKIEFSDEQNTLLALISALESKGILSRQDILDELKMMKWEEKQKANGN